MFDQLWMRSWYWNWHITAVVAIVNNSVGSGLQTINYVGSGLQNIFACKSIIKEEEVQMCVCVCVECGGWDRKKAQLDTQESDPHNIKTKFKPAGIQGSIFFLHYTTSYWNAQQWNFEKLSPTRRRIFTALWKTLHSEAACANHSLVQIFELNSDISYHESNAERYMHHYCRTKVSCIVNKVKARLPRPFPHPPSFFAQVCVQAKMKRIRWQLGPTALVLSFMILWFPSSPARTCHQVSWVAASHHSVSLDTSM